MPSVPALLGAAASRLDPGNAEARSWLEQELSRAAYREHNDPIARALDAFERFIDRLLTADPSVGGALPSLVAGLVTAAILGLLVFSLRYVRRDRRRPGSGTEAVLGSERLTAAQFRARAARALAQERYAAAVVDAVRAIAQEAAERALLDDAPSLTAHEIALRLLEPFPAHGEDLRAAADLFDVVAYGALAPSRAQAERVVALEADLARTRPARRQPREPATGAGAAPGAGPGLEAGAAPGVDTGAAPGVDTGAAANGAAR